MEYEVIVEVPKGSRNKYEFDRQSGVLRLDRQLFTATRYPVDFGFIPTTLADDDDPLDAPVIVDEPTFPGCHITCRSVGVLWMHDEHGLDVKILSVPAGDSRMRWTDLPDVPDHVRDEIRHFFEIYKDLEPGKTVEVDGWKDRKIAEAEIRRAAARQAGKASDPAER